MCVVLECCFQHEMLLDYGQVTAHTCVDTDNQIEEAEVQKTDRTSWISFCCGAML